MRNPPEIVLEWGTAPAERGVSVAVSLYNYADHIAECLDSIAAQDHGPLELVVVDDASARDDSLGVAAGWMRANAERFARGLLVRHRRNGGLARARNTGFHYARCPLVMVMDADNALFPPAIRKLRRALEASRSAAAYSQLVTFGDTETLGLADYWSKRLLSEGTYVDAMALVSRAAWERVGGYTDMDGWEDYDFWCKLAENGYEAAFVPELLCRYRVHQTSMLRTYTKDRYESLYSRMVLRHPWIQLA